MSLKSSFLSKLNTQSIETHFSSSCIDETIQEHKSVSKISKYSPLKPSQLCPPTKKLVSHLKTPSEPSRCSRATPGRYSQRQPSKNFKTNGLTNAIKNNDLKSLKSLLKYGVNPNEKDSTNVPVLLLTIENSGKPEMLKTLLESHADPNVRQPLTLRTGLHLAARYGYQSIARQLLSANAQINLVDSKGDSALMSAVRSEHSSMVKLLIQHGANLDLKNSNNSTALHLAVEKKNENLIKVLLSYSTEVLNDQNDNGMTPLLLSCKGNLMEVAECIILKLSDHSTIEYREHESGKTALHWAVFHKTFSLIEQLLFVGADPNAQDKNSETPFSTTVKNNLPENTIEVFLKYGADVHTTDRFNKTLHHYAASNSKIKLLPLLVNLGADLNARCNEGMTALMISSLKNNSLYTQKLLSLGSQHNLFDIDHATPLVYAILGDSRSLKSHDKKNETILHLIRFGADLNEPANLFNIVKKYHIQLACDVTSLAEVRLYSPLEIAYLTGNSTVFEILIQSGCSFKSFMVEYLVLNELYEENCMNFENMIEVWKYKKTQPRSLSELCRRPCLMLLNKCKTSKYNLIIDKIIEDIKKPIVFTSLFRNNSNIYSSCRKKNTSNVKSLLKLQRSLSFVKYKTPVLQNSPSKCSVSASFRTHNNDEFSKNNNKRILMRTKSNQVTPLKDEIPNTPQKKNLFNRLSLSATSKTNLFRQNHKIKDNLSTNNKSNETALNGLFKELKKPSAKITHQNFLIR